MGKRGPKRTPTEILKLDGSRHLGNRVGEPQAPQKSPALPRGLSAEAQAYWHEVVARLEVLGVIGSTDGETLKRYCQTSAMRDKCFEVLECEGPTYAADTKSGERVYERPEARLVNAYNTELLRIEQQFGLTPSARASLNIKPTEAGSSAEKKFFGT